MSFHPNDVVRRGRLAGVLVILTFAFLVSAFFRTQILRQDQYVLQSESNRLRQVPIPAQRGSILDRTGKIIAEDVPGYSVSVLAPREDSLRAALARLGRTIPITPHQVEAAVRRFKRAPNRPTVVLPDAPFDVVSVLEERRIEYPNLIIQSAPKRYYPDGPALAAIVGYTGEITERELALPQFREYKAGHQVGKDGLEKQYEALLRGREGTHFVEADARGRVVREAGARADIAPESAPALRTSIDLDLQRYMAEVFGDSVQGGAVALVPETGEVLALYSNPTFDPNRFIGGIPEEYWRTLQDDPRRPLYNKAIKGTYPPASTWKLATSAIALEAGLVRMDETMPVSCGGGMNYGSRYFRCWDKRGHGNVNLRQAIEKSCDTYFYQLGLRISLQRLVGNALEMGFGERSGIDLPNETRPRFPAKEVREYYNRRYGARGWTNAVTLNLSIGQGENSQTVANMAKFYTALATDGRAATPRFVLGGAPERRPVIRLSAQQMEGLRLAMAGVVSGRGTAGSAAIQGVTLAGKTGTAQTGQPGQPDHAWFVGFAPVEQPKIVVAVMVEFGEHGYYAARVASRIIERYLKAPTTIQPSVVQGE